MAAGDLFWDAVYVAMHMDDAGLSDVKGNALTLTGGVTRSATQSKFGGYSAHFDGVDDEITADSPPLWDIDLPTQSAQFFVFPETQLSTDPCVFKFRNIKIEYKPLGYAYGFVIDIGGTKVSCGVHAENAWHFIWFTISASTVKLCINGVLIGAFTAPAYSGYDFCIGSGALSGAPDTAFKGYVDDLLITKAPVEPIYGSNIRTDYSIPTAAFFDRLPDPEGPADGPISFTGTVTGIVAPVGPASGVITVSGAGESTIPCAGPASGRVRFSGLSEGTVGLGGIVDGAIRISGAGLAYLGLFGTVNGAIRLSGAGAASHGVSGLTVAGIAIGGAAAGTTTEHPVGGVHGALRVTGRAIGIGGPGGDSCH